MIKTKSSVVKSFHGKELNFKESIRVFVFEEKISGFMK